MRRNYSFKSYFSSEMICHVSINSLLTNFVFFVCVYFPMKYAWKFSSFVHLTLYIYTNIDHLHHSVHYLLIIHYSRKEAT